VRVKPIAALFNEYFRRRIQRGYPKEMRYAGPCSTPRGDVPAWKWLMNDPDHVAFPLEIR